MTYAQAQNILDLRRAGADIPAHVVKKALELTGDLQPDSLDEIITTEGKPCTP